MDARIANRIKELCDEEGITPYAFSKRIGRKPNTITRVIKGERFPSDDLMADICHGFNKDVGEIFHLPNVKKN